MGLVLSGSNAQLTIEPREYVDSSSEIICDRNWVRTKVVLCIDEFCAETRILLQAGDFASLLDSLHSIHQKNEAHFETIEESFSFIITMKNEALHIKGQMKIFSGATNGLLSFQFPCLTDLESIRDQTENVVIEFPQITDGIE